MSRRTNARLTPSTPEPLYVRQLNGVARKNSGKLWAKMVRHPQRLVHFIIGKSIIEALLITAVAVAFYLVTTNPSLHGWLDQANGKTISGWAVDESNPQSRVELQLFVDGAFIEHRSAADFRPDVRAANRAQDDWHGFVFNTPALPAGEHEARVYAMHVAIGGDRRTLQLIGKPLRFRTEAVSNR